MSTPRPAARGGSRIARRPSWLSRQLQDHARAIAATLGAIRRRPVGMLLTAFVVGITLALPAGLHTLLRNLDTVSGGLQGTLRTSLFLRDSVDADRGLELSQSLAKKEGVVDARYIPRDKALEEFRRYSGFGDALDMLKDNPLPAVIVVTPDSHAPQARIDALLKQLAALPEVEQAKLDRQWLERLYAIVDIVKRAVLMIAALLALAVLVVIGNTIRLDIESRREEIVVLKLIGAGNAFIRRPFLYTGLWYGLAGAILACLLVQAGVFALAAPAQHLAGLYDSAAHLRGLSAGALAAVFVTGILLGWIGAFWTVSRHLGRIEPN
jgi:cell division transport system permease protein